MFHQWAFLKHLKWSGHAHDPQGLDNTKPGQCVVLCWACPHKGINLPDKWQDMDQHWKFLYTLILAMDANFWLCNKLNSHKCGDPELGPGWVYFVPPEQYKNHIKTYMSEKDVSQCDHESQSIINKVMID